MSDSKVAHRHYPAMSQQEYSRMLEKRALAMSQKNGFISQLDSAFCTFLIDYLDSHREKSSATRFTAKLTGIFVRALEELAYPRTEAATRFIERYNQIGRQVFPRDWQDIKSIRLTHLDGLGYQSEKLDIVHVIKSVSSFMVGSHEEYHFVDFAVLESERKVLLLHFQRFLAEVWENGGAKDKEYSFQDKTLSGVFDHTRFTTYHLDTYLIFKFSDLNDEFYSFQLAIPFDDRAGYLAKIVECKIDLISALQMMREVADNFDLRDYCEVTDEDSQPILPA